MTGCFKMTVSKLKCSLVSAIGQLKDGTLTGRFTAVAVFAIFEPTQH